MTDYRNWHGKCWENTMWNLPTLERVESRLWKAGRFDLFYVSICRYRLLTKAWDVFSSLAAADTVFAKPPRMPEWDTGLWGRSSGLESQNVSAVVHLRDHPDCSTSSPESKDCSKFTSQEQGWVKTLELQTNSSVLPLALGSLCHIPKKETVNRYIWTTNRKRESLWVWGCLE